MEEKLYYVYILSNQYHTVMYTGVTSDLGKRLYEHSNELADGFTKRYHVHELLYYEIHGEIDMAIKREKVIKKWKRDWKWALIDKVNPKRKNLYIDNVVLPLPISLD